MCELKIRKIWELSYEDYCTNGFFHSAVQKNAARAVLNCKSGKLGVNLSRCSECGHVEFHNNSCRNRNCPNCQAVQKEIWVDKRRAEVIDSPYFHVVFTLPHELNPLIYCNQNLFYGLLHRCCAETLLKLISFCISSFFRCRPDKVAHICNFYFCLPFKFFFSFY